MIPTRKISETILDFGAPILRQMPNDPAKKDLEAAFRVIVMAWNAVVLDDWHKTNKYEKAFLKMLQPIPPTFRGLPEEMIKRKKGKFAHDPRAVGDYWIVEKNGGLVFRAEARVDLESIETLGTKQ